MSALPGYINGNVSTQFSVQIRKHLNIKTSALMVHVYTSNMNNKTESLMVYSFDLCYNSMEPVRINTIKLKRKRETERESSLPHRYHQFSTNQLFIFLIQADILRST